MYFKCKECMECNLNLLFWKRDVFFVLDIKVKWVKG